MIGRATRPDELESLNAEIVQNNFEIDMGSADPGLPDIADVEDIGERKRTAKVKRNLFAALVICTVVAGLGAKAYLTRTDRMSGQSNVPAALIASNRTQTIIAASTGPVAEPKPVVPIETTSLATVEGPSSAKAESAVSAPAEQQTISSPKASVLPDSRINQVTSHTRALENPPLQLAEAIYDHSPNNRRPSRPTTHVVFDKAAAIARAPSPPLRPAPATSIIASSGAEVSGGLGSDSVKPLIPLTAAAINLVSITDDTLQIEGSDGSRVKYHAKDLLPTGERVDFIDAAAMTIVTDRRVIKITN